MGNCIMMKVKLRRWKPLAAVATLLDSGDYPTRVVHRRGIFDATSVLESRVKALAPVSPALSSPYHIACDRPDKSCLSDESTVRRASRGVIVA